MHRYHCRSSQETFSHTHTIRTRVYNNILVPLDEKTLFRLEDVQTRQCPCEGVSGLLLLNSL